QIDRVVRPHMDAVRPRILALSPGAQEIAVAVEHHHRMLSAAKGIDIVVLVDADRGDLLERPAVRQFRPVLDDAVLVVAASADRRQGLIALAVRANGRGCRSLPPSFHNRHARESGHPGASGGSGPWIPALRCAPAGMTAGLYHTNGQWRFPSARSRRWLRAGR